MLLLQVSEVSARFAVSASPNVSKHDTSIFICTLAHSVPIAALFTLQVSEVSARFVASASGEVSHAVRLLAKRAEASHMAVNEKALAKAQV